jgi:hypothetical protein
LRVWGLLIATFFLLAFAALGARGLSGRGLFHLRPDEAAQLRRDFRPETTTDAYIRELLRREGVAEAEIRRPTASARRAFGALGAGDLIFVAPRADASRELMYMVVKSIALPRRVHLRYCDGARDESHDPVAGVLTYLLDPLEGAEPIFPRLALSTESRAWTSFCSRSR